MKKRLFTIAIVFMMVLGASAQTDGFFMESGSGNSGNRTDISVTLPRLPGGSVGETHTDQTAPLGSGLLILTALSAGYAISRKNTRRGE